MDETCLRDGADQRALRMRVPKVAAGRVYMQVVVQVECQQHTPALALLVRKYKY